MEIKTYAKLIWQDRTYRVISFNTKPAKMIGYDRLLVVPYLQQAERHSYVRAIDVPHGSYMVEYLKETVIEVADDEFAAYDELPESNTDLSMWLQEDMQASNE